MLKPMCSKLVFVRVRSGCYSSLPLQLENIREIDDSISVTIVLFSESGKMVANKHR